MSEMTLGRASVELGDSLQLVFRASTGAVQATFELPDAKSIDDLVWLLQVAREVQAKRGGDHARQQ